MTSGLVPGRDPSAPPIRLVALGDSSLTGPGLEDPDHIWLREALARLEQERPVEVISLAVGGSRAADLLRRVAEVGPLAPDLVVVAVGSNDVIHGTPRRLLAAQVDAILERLTGQVPVVAMANIGDLGNVARIPPPLEAVLRVRSKAACKAIEAVVDRHPGAVLLDVTASDQGFRDRRVFAADLFHPGELGHSLWADAAAPGLGAAFARLEQSTTTVPEGEGARRGFVVTGSR